MYSSYHNYYEPEYPSEDLYAPNIKLEDKLAEAKDWLESIVKMVYSKKPLDICEFESQLDELCCVLDVKIGEGELQIKGIEEHKETVSALAPMLDCWKAYNHQYLTKLA